LSKTLAGIEKIRNNVLAFAKKDVQEAVDAFEKWQYGDRVMI